jgi:hypothetical protein
MKIATKIFIVFYLLVSVVISVSAQSKKIEEAGNGHTAPSGAVSTALSDAPSQSLPAPYFRPSEKTKLRNYAFDVIGPYPLLGAAFAAGINQAENTPPEWGQGAQAYGKRIGSDFGITTTTTTARYVFAKFLSEDTIYYRCGCSGILPRLGHAVTSTVTARRGEDGHYVFSIPSILSPYAGTMAAVYLWFPDRYNAKDGFRMGNYNLLGFVGGNIALEFIYGGPHTLMSRIHKKKPVSSD